MTRKYTDADWVAAFWLRVNKTETCWLWTGPSLRGYGYFSRRGLAHHFLVGKPPLGLEYDHLCRVRNCVRPDHLELVTHAVNVRRTPRWRTHCKRGHAFDEKNTRIDRKGMRQCRKCDVIRTTRSRKARAPRRNTRAR